MRNWISFVPLDDHELFEKKLCRLVLRYRHAAVLSDKYPFYEERTTLYHDFDLLAGFDALDLLEGDLSEVEAEARSWSDWLLGHLSYDLKNHLEPNVFSGSANRCFHFGPISFFRPRYLIRRVGETWDLGYDSEADSLATCQQFLDRLSGQEFPGEEEVSVPPEFHARVSKAQYIKTVEELKRHIHRGDIYEVNYCFESFSKGIAIDPASVFNRLQKVSPMPFSVLYKQDNSFLIGASPERYLRSKDNRVLSQPMKGTFPRPDRHGSSLAGSEALSGSEKERAENIMIADLVRNDLSRIAARGTVRVDELCGIFPYPGLFQMVSTISAERHRKAGWLDPVRVSFPMGSMTGAPKIRAMQLIEKYEEDARGLYSGAIGYITPEQDFDFSVVIRSLLYNADNEYLSYSVGSAVTALCNPYEEYEECLLKAEAWQKIFR